MSHYQPKQLIEGFFFQHSLRLKAGLHLNAVAAAVATESNFRQMQNPDVQNNSGFGLNELNIYPDELFAQLCYNGFPLESSPPAIRDRLSCGSRRTFFFLPSLPPSVPLTHPLSLFTVPTPLCLFLIFLLMPRLECPWLQPVEPRPSLQVKAHACTGLTDLCLHAPQVDRSHSHQFWWGFFLRHSRPPTL